LGPRSGCGFLWMCQCRHRKSRTPASEIQNADSVLLQPINALVADDDPIQQLVTKNFKEGRIRYKSG